MEVVNTIQGWIGTEPHLGPRKAATSAYDPAMSLAQEYWSPVCGGDVDMVRGLCDCIKAEGHKLPLRSMLQAAVQGSSVEMLEYLFAEGAKVDIEIDQIKPISDGRPIEFFHVLTKHGWPKGPRGLTVNLHHGIEVVKLILARGSRVGFLCVKSAVRSGDVQVAELLLGRINLSAKVPDAYDISKTLDNVERWYGPEMNSEPPSLKRIINDAGLLHMAALDQNADMVRFLLSKGADVNHVPLPEQCCRRPNGTALHKAVSGPLEGRISNPEVVQALLVADADPKLLDELDRTPIEINDRYGDRETKETIRKLLLEGMPKHTR